VLVIPGTVALGILAAASLASQYYEQLLLRCQTIKPGIGRAFCRRSWVEIIRLVFIRVRIHALSIGAFYSGCEDLLSVHFTDLPLHRTAFSVGEDLPVGY
jgi:hypothetical protein